jgi:hypothetical protein
MKSLYFFQIIFLFLFISLPSQAQNNVTLFSDNGSGQIQFSVGEIQSALNEKGQKSVVSPVSQIKQVKSEYNIILLNIGNKANLQLLKGVKIEKLNELKSEGFIIHKESGNKTLWILGKDDAGVMYGGLEVAEIIKVKGIDAVQNQLQNPYMKVRGTKYNIPLDMRSPTYTEPSDAAQKNMAKCGVLSFGRNISTTLPAIATTLFRFGTCIRFHRW